MCKAELILFFFDLVGDNITMRGVLPFFIDYPLVQGWGSDNKDVCTFLFIDYRLVQGLGL